MQPGVPSTITRTEDVYERFFSFGTQLTERTLQKVDNLSKYDAVTVASDQHQVQTTCRELAPAFCEKLREGDTNAHIHTHTHRNAHNVL